MFLSRFLPQKITTHTAWRRGQSMVEIAITLPMLLILISGLLEFGFILNEYMTLQDAVRNAARFASDSDYRTADPAGVCDDLAQPFPYQACCNATRDFYRQAACLVNREITLAAPDVTLACYVMGANNRCEYGALDPNSGDAGRRNDIVVSVFSVLQDNPPQILRFPFASTGNGGEAGWSYSQEYVGYGGGRNQSSRFTSTEVQGLLNSTAPSTGYVLIEVFYNYDQKLKLPWITAFVDDPALLHVYTFMPLVSAEPTPTPIPE